MRSEDATAAARVSAANAILDRGWGKAAQPLEDGDGGALQLIHKIERIIVHPQDAEAEDRGDRVGPKHSSSPGDADRS